MSDNLFEYHLLPDDRPFLIPTGMTRFKCVILIEREVSEEFRDEVSAQLVRAGCLFTIAWGRDCSLWDDSVDWAFVLHYEGDYPEDKFVMTSWHEDETLEEAVAFARDCSDVNFVPIDDVLVLDFGTAERGRKIENLYRGE